MANIATVLKDEVARLVRKQLRSETEGIKKASSRYRADIAAMKRRIESLEKRVAYLEKAAPHTPAPVPVDEDGTKLRFSPQRLRAQRARLGLSAANMGLLVGVSAKSVYDWEAGAKRPRAGHLALIATVRKMGKREAHARLEDIHANRG